MTQDKKTIYNVDHITCDIVDHSCIIHYKTTNIEGWTKYRKETVGEEEGIDLLSIDRLIPHSTYFDPQDDEELVTRFPNNINVYCTIDYKDKRKFPTIICKEKK